jgi:hypothetical protein
MQRLKRLWKFALMVIAEVVVMVIQTKGIAEMT